MSKEGGKTNGRREKSRWEAGYPRWREPGEIGNILQHCIIFCNKKTHKELGTNKGGNRETHFATLHDILQ